MDSQQFEMQNVQNIRTSNIQSHPPKIHSQKQEIREVRRAPVDRRISEHSARQLARKVFSKYSHDREEEFMSNDSASQLISDLYASINVEHDKNEKEGFQFIIANDVNNDNAFCMKDFEDIFVRHLSTGDGSGYDLFFEKPIPEPASRRKHIDSFQASSHRTSGYSRTKQVVSQQQPQTAKIFSQTHQAQSQQKVLFPNQNSNIQTNQQVTAHTVQEFSNHKKSQDRGSIQSQVQPIQVQAQQISRTQPSNQNQEKVNRRVSGSPSPIEPINQQLFEKLKKREMVVNNLVNIGWNPDDVEKELNICRKLFNK